MVFSFVFSASLREGLCLVTGKQQNTGLQKARRHREGSGIPKNHGRVARGLDGGFWEVPQLL